jgi:hypothetical protein
MIHACLHVDGVDIRNVGMGHHHAAQMVHNKLVDSRRLLLLLWSWNGSEILKIILLVLAKIITAIATWKSVYSAHAQISTAEAIQYASSITRFAPSHHAFSFAGGGGSGNSRPFSIC